MQQMKICENKNIKKCLEFQGLTINAEKRLAVKGNKEIEFTFTEFEILLNLKNLLQAYLKWQCLMYVSFVYFV